MSIDEMRRSPYGERGLKFCMRSRPRPGCGSLSLRRAWIEIIQDAPVLRLGFGRSPYGERGLKSTAAEDS